MMYIMTSIMSIMEVYHEYQASVEPSLRSGFYTELFGDLNHVETS